MATTGQTASNNQTAGSGIPRSILQDLGWPQALIEDYDRISQNDFAPQCGTQTPIGNVTSNQGLLYIRISGDTRELYFNPVAGVNTGWVQLI